MTTIEMSVRDMMRKGDALSQYDLIFISDKKSKRMKGLFVAPRYASLVEDFLGQKKKEELSQKTTEFLSFAGACTGAFGEKNIQDFKKNAHA